jgi:hypothetical protein
MEGMFYPCVHLGDFEDAYAALHSVGINGLIADMCAAGLNDNPGQPAAYQACMEETIESDTRTIIVLAPLDGLAVRLCYGFLDLIADTEEGALRLIRVATAISPDETDSSSEPQFYAYRWLQPRKVLQ